MASPEKDQWYMRIARVVSERATCARRSVGCVLVNDAGHIVATGYNGPPRGFSHCTAESPCGGASAPSGTALDLCEAVHAEQNALLQCQDVESVTTCYVTTTPCVMCVKLLLNTGCSRIVYADEYPHINEVRDLWVRRAGRRLDIVLDETVTKTKP